MNGSVDAINRWGKRFADVVVEEVVGREQLQPHDIIMRRTFTHVPGVIARTLAAVERGTLSPDAAWERLERLPDALDDDAATDAQIRHALSDAVRQAADRARTAAPRRLPPEPLAPEREPEPVPESLRRQVALPPGRRRRVQGRAREREPGVGPAPGRRQNRTRGVVAQREVGRGIEHYFYDDEPPPGVW